MTNPGRTVRGEPSELRKDNQMTENKTAPWVFGKRGQRHRGVEVTGDGKLLTVAEAIKQGGLDWMVELRNPISDDEDQVTAPDWRQVVKVEDVVRDGKVEREHRTLGMVKGRYTVLQNRDAFAFFDRATLEGAAVLKAVGHLNYGAVVWAVAERSETVELLPGDEIRQSLILVTAHDGSHAVKVVFSSFRPATGTMLAAKVSRHVRTEVKVRHTKSIDDRMEDLHNVLAKQSDYFKQWRAALVGQDGQGGFKRRIVTEGEVQKVLEGLFPSKKKLDEDGNEVLATSTRAKNARKAIMDRIEDQAAHAKQAYESVGQEAPNGTTALDVFLGVSEYVGKDRTAKNEGNNWVVSTFGTGADMRQKAFDLISRL